MFTNVPGYNWKEPVPTEPDLPTVGNSTGDVRVVVSPLETFQWDGSTWNTFGGGGGGGGTWGSITGTLSDQLDLQSALNAKAPTASPTFTGTITTPLTASRAVATGGSGQLVASATTATELGLLSGKTAVGDVSGPGSSVDNGIPRFDGTTGKIIQSGSLATISDTGNLLLDNNNNVMVGWPSVSTGMYRDTGSGGLALFAGGSLNLTMGSSAGISSVAAARFGFGSNPVIVELNAGAVANTTILRSVLGKLLVRGGQTSGATVGQPVQVEGGPSITAQAAGNTLIYEGEAQSTGPAGEVHIGRTASASVIRVNTRLQANAANTATLTNAPVAGNPTGWLKLQLNGTQDIIIPYWNAP